MNNLKKIVLALFLLGTTIFYGQRRPDRDKIKSLKVAFLTERLDLNSAEAQAFWPVYNEYQDSKEALRKKERTQIRGKIKDADALSEKQAQDLLDKYISFENEEEALENDFLKEISTVISAKKTILLMKAEEDFKRRLIQQYRKNRSGGGGYR